MRTSLVLALCVSALTVLATAFLPNAFAADEDAWKQLAPLSGGERIFVGKLKQVIPGPVAKSDPPIYSFKLEFEPLEMLRGDKPDATAFHYQIRQADPPDFPTDKTWLVAARRDETNWVITYLVTADKDLIAKAKVIASLPAGWSIEGGKPVSPWATLGDKAWPKDAPRPDGPACSKSGRPALLSGGIVELTVEQVPPAVLQKYKNPFGDGQFKVTVTNRRDKPVTVPALLTDGKTIFWADSLLVIYHGQARTLPGAGHATAARPTEIKPGESVSTVLDLLPLEGVEWPRGGSRVYFDFALGEKTATNFFYYYSSLHDAMRDEALKKLKEGKP